MSAIFLLVVLAALGATMLHFTNVQQSTSMLDIEGTRAYWAAKSGVDWGMYQALNPDAPASAWCACPNGCSGGGTTTASGSITSGNFTVTVSCTCLPDCEASTPRQMRWISATACNQPAAGACPNPAPTSANYVNRHSISSVRN